jgi:hypothetical protein
VILGVVPARTHPKETARSPGTHSTYFRSQAEPYLAVRWPTHWAANIVASRSGCREAPWDMARYHPPCGLPVSLPRPTSTSKCRPNRNTDRRRQINAGMEVRIPEPRSHITDEIAVTGGVWRRRAPITPRRPPSMGCKRSADHPARCRGDERAWLPRAARLTRSALGRRPASTRALRNRNPICALLLRNSSCAQRLIAS